jgi:Ankyrin repeats (3 copies)
MGRNSEPRSAATLARHGCFEELRRRARGGERLDLPQIFERAVTDFRTVRRLPGHQQILLWCLDQGLDLSARAGWLNQPVVCLAAAAGNNSIVEEMARRGLPTDPFIRTAVGDFEYLEPCRSSHDLSALRDENGFNLLFYCAQSGLGRRDPVVKERLTGICRFLLDCGVCPGDEMQAALPIFPAFLCAASGGNEQIMTLLLENGGLRAERSHQVLEHALEPHQRSGEPFNEIAKLVLRHGFDINSWSAGQGRTLLHGSANRGSLRAVSWLLQHGSDPNALDERGRTPLHVCAERNTSTSALRLLIDAGADPRARDAAGNTPLDTARANGRDRIVEYLSALDR